MLMFAVPVTVEALHKLRERRSKDWDWQGCLVLQIYGLKLQTSVVSFLKLHLTDY